MSKNRTVYLIIGYLLGALAIGMIPPLLLDFAQGSNNWQSFMASAGITAFVAISLILTNRGDLAPLTVKHAFLLTNWAWIALVTFSALPLMLGENQLSFTDAFFEAMSGLTTTGSTVLSGLDEMASGTLLWRAMLNWFGGIGIIVMAISVLPMLNIGGMQLFRMESSDTSEKILPRAREIAGGILRIYLFMTFTCMIAYWIAGMSFFDALAHAMTTISTAGFSTHDESFGFFNSTSINLVAFVFILASSLPFTSYLFLTSNRLNLFWQDSQIRVFLLTVLSALAAMFILVQPDIGWSHVLLNTASIISGTGYTSSDYSQWGGLAIALFFVLTFLGGCAGSATCALKTFRLQVLFLICRKHVRQLAVPHGVFSLKYNGKHLPDQVAYAVVSFTLIYFATFTVFSLALSFVGLDMLTAMSAAATAIANVGPGLGETIGPNGNFASLSDSAKWILSAAMLLGRLEFLTVLVMLSPSFWARA